MIYACGSSCLPFILIAWLIQPSLDVFQAFILHSLSTTYIMNWLKINIQGLSGKRSNIGFFDNQEQVAQVNGSF